MQEGAEEQSREHFLGGAEKNEERNVGKIWEICGVLSGIEITRSVTVCCTEAVECALSASIKERMMVICWKRKSIF